MTHTYIGTSMVIDGEISGDEDLVVEGTVKGRIALRDNVQIANSAIVEGDIESSSVTISGQVTGNVRATDRVELKADGRMIGDIRSQRIQIAEGATFKGNIDMDAA